MKDFAMTSDKTVLDAFTAGAPDIQSSTVRSCLTSTQANRLSSVVFFFSDILALILSLLLGSWLALTFHNIQSGHDVGSRLIWNASKILSNGAPIGMCLILYLIVTGEYRTRRPFWSEFGRLIGASFCTVLAAGFYAFAFQIADLRSATLMPWILFPVVAEICRHASRYGLHHFRLWQIPTVLVGTPESSAVARKVLNSEAFSSAEITDEVSVERATELLLSPTNIQTLRNYQILLCVDPNTVCTHDLIERLTRHRLSFALLPQTTMPAHGLTYSSFFSHDTVIMSYRSNLEEPVQRIIKFAFDTLVAAMLLFLALPVFVILYLLIALDGGQPIYGHRRIGHNGKEFYCLKFRSMARNSDELLARLLASNPEAAEEWHQTQKLQHDPRITKIGHFIRKTSLDELPQLINVLRGDMSLVGPRPIVQAEVHHYAENIAYYYAIRPGITGVWQVSGRSDTGYAERVQFDRWYVRNWTLWHDITILAKTLPAVLLRRGAR